MLQQSSGRSKLANLGTPPKFFLVLVTLVFFNYILLQTYFNKWQLHYSWRLARGAAVEAEDKLAISFPPVLEHNFDYTKKIVFGFVHLRKAGGSSIRELLVSDMKGVRASIYIPCHYGLRCDLYTLAGLYPYASYGSLPVQVAGHFPYVDIQRFAEGFGMQNFSCLTQLRKPTSRVISCLYYRYTEMRFNRTISLASMSEEEFHHHLHTFRDRWRHGCNNEIARMFSSLLDERILNDFDMTTSLAKHVEATAKENMSKCVVLLLEEGEENQKMMNYWFPSLVNFAKNITSKKSNVYRFAEKAEVLPPRFIDIVNEVNEMDVRLYEYGAWLHKQQYEYAKIKLKERNALGYVPVAPLPPIPKEILDQERSITRLKF